MDNADSTAATLAQYRILFWSKLETKIGSIVPKFLKDNFRNYGLDNFSVITQYTDNDINEIEQIVQKDIKTFVKKDSTVDDLFHQLQNSPESFRLRPSDKYLIKDNVKWAKENPILKDNIVTMSFKRAQQLITQTDSTYTDQDIESNKQHLNSLITNFINSVKKNLNLIQPSLASEIVVDIKLISDSTTSTLVATVICPVCKNEYSIKKCKSSGNRSGRWVVSNFKLHINNHIKSQDICPPKRKKQMSTAEKLQHSNLISLTPSLRSLSYTKKTSNLPSVSSSSSSSSSSSEAVIGVAIGNAINNLTYSGED